MALRRQRTADVQKLRARTTACRVFGHRWSFGVKGSDMVWFCDRGCGIGGRRPYADPDEARYYAQALHRRRPGPPSGLLTALGGVVQRREKRARRSPGSDY